MHLVSFILPVFTKLIVFLFSILQIKYGLSICFLQCRVAAPCSIDGTVVSHNKEFRRDIHHSTIFLWLDTKILSLFGCSMKNKPSTRPVIFCCLSWTGLPVQQSEKRSRDLPLPSQLLQLFQGDQGAERHLGEMPKPHQLVHFNVGLIF